MARAKNSRNGRLEEKVSDLDRALSALIQAQASLAQNQASFLTQMAESERQSAETNRVNAERFARIEAILLEHSRILHGLPDAIRDKIGFKA